MNWGQLKTNFFSGMKDRAGEFDQYDFGQYADAAQIELVSALPSHMIPECLERIYPTIDTSTASLLNVPAAYPVTGMKAVSVMVNIDSSVNGPVYRQSRFMLPSDFFSALGVTGDLIWTQLGSFVLLGAEPEAAVGGRDVQIVQKVNPATYIQQYGDEQETFFGYARTEYSGFTLSANQLVLLNGASGGPALMVDLGLNWSPYKFNGGMCIYTDWASGIPQVRLTGNMARVVSIADASSGAVLTLDPVIDTGSGRTLAVTMFPSSSGSEQTVLSDSMSPNIAPRWHRLMLEIMLANAWLRVGDFNRFQAHDANIKSSMQALGAYREERS